MHTHTITIVSHASRSPEDVLSGDNGLTADHSLGITSFTSEAKDGGGKVIETHRFGIMILADSDTAHSLKMNDQMTVRVICGMLDRFKDALYELFGEETCQLSIMQGVAEMLGVEDDDGPFTDEDAEEAGESKELLNAAYRAQRGSDNVH